MEKKTTKNSAAVSLGRRGGNAFVKKYGKKKMKELGKQSAKSRWGKKSVAKVG